MVVSKDSKRKRKESPPPPQPTVESSPEMPKRTKVQAQRKFAQGQSAPASSYSSIIAASSSSNTGPSTSSESREPPTEILPNKRPKTEDFLTFLCFRGTPTLPVHLDYLNQGKSKETEKPIKKNVSKPTKAKKGKKGKPKAAVKTEESKASTSSAAAALETTKNEKPPVAIIEEVINTVDPELTSNDPVISFAVRKRAEVVVEGNRRGRAAERQLRNTADIEKCNNSPESKRRSNRTSTKDVKPIVDAETDEEEEYFSANDEAAKLEESAAKNEPKKSKTPVSQGRKSETPSKESEETGKSRMVKAAATTTKKGNKDVQKGNANDVIKAKETPKMEPKADVPIKEKPPVKRPRQKESPIFIPSPEPSGRMTRQRAFFEPVKVPPRNDEDVKKEENKEDVQCDSVTKPEHTENQEAKVLTKASEVAVKDGQMDQNGGRNIENDKGKCNLNIFDFSSDDEQPLAKAIKLKKGKGSPKKAAARANKPPGRKLSPQKAVEIKDELKSKSQMEEQVAETKKEDLNNLDDKLESEMKPDDAIKNKNKKGKNAKKKIEDNFEETDKDLTPPSPKKALNARQSRKKTKSDSHTANGEETATKDVSPSGPIRNQRPSRKTKEAAAIYMGIIGHKLQLADDEDDDLSLNSFPDLPNVKEMEKMEIELKKNAAQSATSSAVAKCSPKQPTTDSPVTVEKPPSARRGRPPKQSNKSAPAKREIEGMLVKKGAITKMVSTAGSVPNKDKSEHSNKIDSEDEDFLLNEEVNETKRKLEKSFSDSDDEPLAIKAHIKTSEKDSNEQDPKKCNISPQNSTKTLSMLPLTAKPVHTPPLSTSQTPNASPITAPQPTTPSPFKTIEKKSPVPTSKILNVPATYGIPSVLNSGFNKSTSYLPQASPHYHTSHVRPAIQSFPTAKSPTGPAPTGAPSTHLTAPPLPQPSPLKYQTPPTTYPPPIEAYPSPKINPNFLTPKFDRTSLPRTTNNFPSPSPVKFDVSVSSTTSKIGGGIVANSTLSPKTTTLMGSSVVPAAFITTLAAATTSGTVAAANSNDPLKDEIGSILAANLMPSKEESGKIFGIASVSLAQSSGPDNTKCTLGKCGSIHKPVLGPVVPTEGYIGDQLSSKERRKAKVNMTHEQIQKWLIECSSNPDEIQDDLDDDFDDNLRPNLFATTPPPTRDDKESTSFSSSSKATRDLGKSESAWSAKGPSLKATPVVAQANRKDEVKHLEPANQLLEVASENDKASGQAINLTHKSAMKQNSNANEPTKATKEKLEKKADKKLPKEDKSIAKEFASKDKQSRIDKEKEQPTSSTKTTLAGKQSTAVRQSPSSLESPSTSKQNRKKNLAATPPTHAVDDKSPSANIQKAAATTHSGSNTSTAAGTKTPKRTPVYNQKSAQKQVELKVTTTTSHKKTAPFSYGAFSVENEKSIYSFDKDDDEAAESKQMSKPTFRRQSRRDSITEEAIATTTPTSRTSPTKKRAAAAAAEKANKDIANASQSSSVSLTLSPAEKSKHVKVSLDAEKPVPAKTGTGKAAKAAKKQPEVAAATNEADSESDGQTFYIPLQGSGTGKDGEGGIQGVAVKLGREGPEGPNQKVTMHATLVTKAQMGSNSKPLPDTMNISDVMKNLMTTSNVASAGESTKKGANSNATPSTSAAAAAASAAATTSGTPNSASNSLKSVPIGTVQPRFKGSTDPAAAASAAATQQPSTSSGAGGLVRVNSNSSLFSGSAKSRVGVVPAPSTHNANKKFKDDTPIKMSNNTAFPRHDDPTQMVEAPIFRPTEKEFADPIEFIERITPIAARFGICKIIPPATFKPECRISDEMRFTAYNQYVHKMLHRWGPSAKELSAIKKYLATQSIVMNHPPWIGGMEVDLPRLYHTVQELGGLKEVIEKKKWARVAEEMCIPKLAQDRVTKLDDIYCKYLLPYDTLSPGERQKLFDEVEADWAKREARARRNADRFVNTESVSNEEDDVSSEDDEESEEEVDGVSMECIVKGRSMPLSQFYRIARNTMALWFKNTEPTVNEVEAEFWRHVAVRDSHVCVHSGSIDSSGWGYGFPSPGPKGKGSNYARHPWNLKVLTNNPGSVLRSLGPVMGVTVPTLHVGMLFSACCWYRDPHGLSWIEYLHTGASKLWYGIPDDQSANFRAALTSLIPTHCQNKTIWLPCDTVMVPPHMLTDRGVSLCRIEQKPGEFIVVFPRAYTSSLATGYVVSESVYFATTSWMDLAKDDFRDIHDSCEPAMFSLEQLLFALGYDQRVTSDTLQQTLPMLHEVFEKETAAREQLKAAGVTSTEKIHNEKVSKAKKQQPPFKSIDSECDLCRANLYISMVRTEEGSVYCLQHALKNLNNGNIQAKQCKLIYAYNVEDIENLIKNLNDKIHQKQRHVVVSKKAK